MPENTGVYALECGSCIAGKYEKPDVYKGVELYNHVQN